MQNWGRFRFYEHFIHEKWIVEMTPAREGDSMTAPLAHSSWRKNAGGPEDEPFQPFAAWSDAVLTKHALSIVFQVWKASQLTIVNK